MAKKDQIKELLSHPRIEEITEDDLKDMTVKNLQLLKKELDAEEAEELAAKENGDTEEGGTNDNNADDEGGTEESLPPEDASAEEFTSMCGMPYDPSASGSCFTQCSKEFPEEFARCTTHFAATPHVAPSQSQKRAASQGMNEWYHRPGTQGGELDRFFMEGKVGSVDEIAKFADCNPRRVMIHIKHLIADFEINILKTGRKNDDGSVSTVYFWADKDKRRKGEAIKGKTGFPNGFPKSHPCYKEPVSA